MIGVSDCLGFGSFKIKKVWGVVELSDFHEHLLRKIGLQPKDGYMCVICGHDEVTREHVIPNWLQKRLSLSSQKFKRPNGTSMAYGKLKISLCATCNNQDFSQLEKHVAKLLDSNSPELLSSSRPLQIWLTKIYYFLQLFEQSRVVFRRGEDPASLVSDTQIFDAHLLQIMLRSISASPPLIYPDCDFASVWAFECVSDWDISAFAFGASTGQNIVAIKVGSIAIFAVLGDWGQYKKGRALHMLPDQIDEEGFMAAFDLLRYFVDRNRLSTGVVTMGKEDGSNLTLIPHMILAEDMDFSLKGFGDFLSRASW